ncbi:MAG: hypothetical protein KDD04_11570, partial [Sinomicrobium sp.]|nr:hypothetical protein [Sinomicrobium sp.]
MKHTLSFEPSVIRSFQGKVATEKWDDVVAAYDGGACKKAMLLLLDYIDGNIRRSYMTEPDTCFAIPHGSVTVQLRITDTDFTVKALFLKVTETTKRVPLYRRIAELNFSSLNLPQIVLDNEVLYFSYDCPIRCCEPYKIYYALKDICTYADMYDDDFVNKFGAVPAEATKTERYDPRVLDRAYAAIKAFLDEAAGFIQYLEEKRYTNSIWYVVNINIKKIDFYIE